MNERLFVFLILLALPLSGAWAQIQNRKSEIVNPIELPRRAFFGIRMEPVTDDVQRVMNLPAVKGVLIQNVIPGSTAEAAGLKQGDVLLELDGREIKRPASLGHGKVISRLNGCGVVGVSVVCIPNCPEVSDIDDPHP